MRYLWSVNPPNYPGLGAEVDASAPRVVAGPVPAADFNTPWTQSHYRKRQKQGAAMRRRDFRVAMKQNGIRRPFTGLGFAPFAIAAAAKTGGGIVNSIFGHPKDAGRLQTNAQLASRASAGDLNALNELKRMAGLVGDGSGWATATAKNDAKAKYNAIAARLNGGVAPSASASPTVLQAAVASLPPNVQAAVRALTTGTAVDAAIFSTPDIVNTAVPGQAAVQTAQSVAASARPAQVGLSGMSPTTMLMLGGAAYLLLNKKGRR